ncbi:hypothetical protein N7465_010533 [Penicillium sp. CMV-2018d]|nr:hypothetical protein N7465_010533 [Penicillium sp. CMV-2018d]
MTSLVYSRRLCAIISNPTPAENKSECSDKKGKESGVYFTPATWITNAAMEIIKPIPGVYPWPPPLGSSSAGRPRTLRTSNRHTCLPQVALGSPPAACCEHCSHRLSRRVEELEVGRVEELRALKEQMAGLEEKLEAGWGDHKPPWLARPATRDM